MNIESVLQLVNAQCGWDCVIKSFDGYKLKIFSGSSEEYTHPLIDFEGVDFIYCPTSFSHAFFRLARDVEIQQISTQVPLNAADVVIAIEAETMAGLHKNVFFISATDVALA